MDIEVGSGEEGLRQLAATQHGVVSRLQAGRALVSSSAVRWLVDSGRWEPLGRRVLRLRGSPATTRQALEVAVVDAGPGTAVGYWSAAALYGLDGFDALPVHLIGRRRGRATRAVRSGVLHTTRVLPEGHLARIDGVPLTAPARTLFDLSAVLPVGRLARALDTAWARRLVTIDDLRATERDLARRGRARVAVMRALVDERGEGYVAPESGLERRFARVLADDGQPPMELQVQLGGDEWTARVDALDRAARLVVQVDSDRFHSALLDRRHDTEQDRRLVLQGWRVLRIRESDIWHRPRRVAEEVRRARGLRRAAA